MSVQPTRLNADHAARLAAPNEWRFVRRLLLVLACFARAALAQSLELTQYAHTSWRTSDLGSKGPIDAIAQTREGYLWLGTPDGLIRFDGVRGVPWHAPESDHLPEFFKDVLHLMVSRDGALWIGTMGGLGRWRDGKITFYRQFAQNAITAIFEDPQGVVWIGVDSPARLCAIRGPAISCQESRQFGMFIHNIFTDRRGTLWVVSATGVWRWSPGPPRYYPVSEPPFPVFAAEDESGMIIAARFPYGLSRLEGDAFKPYDLPGLRSQVRFGPLVRTRDGSMWITAPSLGLYHLHRAKIDRFNSADGLTSDEVLDVFEDRERNVWVATEKGLDKFSPTAAPLASSKDDFSSGTVWSVQAMPNGSVWLGTPAGLNQWKNGQVVVYADTEPTTDKGNGSLRRVPRRSARNPIYSLGLDSRGSLWASTNRGLVHSNGNEFVAVSKTQRGPAAAIVGDPDGGVWVSYDGIGLDHWSPSGAVRRIQEAKVDGTNSMAPLAVDGRGGLWAGVQRVGVAYLVDGKVRAQYGPAEGLASPYANDLHVSADSAVWVATSGGLSRIKDGRIQTLTTKHGLPCNMVQWSIEDDDRSLWVRTSCGLLRILHADLEAWIRDPSRPVTARIFGGKDGVADADVTTLARPFVTKASDGRIWFVDDRGVRILDPRTAPFNEHPPPVYVEEVKADGRTYETNPQPRGPVRLPPRVRNLAIRFTALSLVAPEKTKFRFMLEGQDSTWREAVNQRVVEYSNLPPRSYRFRVMAANNDDVWNTAGASLDFAIAPAWNQTWWFFALVATAIAAAAAGTAVTWQQRRSRLAADRARARFDAILSERARVARELHDTLLGDMAGVAMQLNAGARRLETLGGVGSGVADLLSGLSTQVQHALIEARRSVTAMRAPPDELRALHEQLARGADRMFADTAIAVSVKHTGTPRSYPPAVEAEILGIASEAMTNARNHAGCRTVTVTCSYDPRALKVCVHDDGRGFDASQPSPTDHWGLVGMRERAASIGATLSVTSSASAGTDILLAMPGGTSRRAWWNSFGPEKA